MMDGMTDEDRSAVLCQFPWGYQEEFEAFIEAEPELMQAALPHLLLLLRRFVMWMRDGDQIDTPEAVELLDALRWLEASVAE